MSNLDLLTEDVITLTEARNFLPEVQTQKGPHVSIIWLLQVWSLLALKSKTVVSRK